MSHTWLFHQLSQLNIARDWASSVVLEIDCQMFKAKRKPESRVSYNGCVLQRNKCKS